MDNSDLAVSLVKVDSTDQEDSEQAEVVSYSSWIGSAKHAKDCHMVWESLRNQGQLFKVLDTLTMKTAQLIGKIQNQTATEEDSGTVVGLLSQLGIMFVDVETKQDGTKEKRYTFVTENEPTAPRQPPITHTTPVQPEEVIPSSEKPEKTSVDADAAEVGSVSDDDPGCVSDLGEPMDSPGKPEPSTSASNVCEWCKKDQGTLVLLDLHKIQRCKVLMRYNAISTPCPTCGRGFRQLARLHQHFLVDHQMEAAEAMKLLHDVKNLSLGQKEKGGSSEPGAAEADLSGHIVCEVCQQKFATRTDLRTHLMDAHDFSRQKAVSSVYESVKSAQQSETLNPSTKAVNLQGYSFQCRECEVIYKDRQDLVHHLMREHNIPRVKSQKEANKQYKEMNSIFACHLCTSKYSDRYVLSKHFMRVHNLSKKQAQVKLREMYPDMRRRGIKKTAVSSSVSKEPTTSKKSQLQVDGDSSLKPKRLLRSAATRSQSKPVKSLPKRLLRNAKEDKISSDDENEKDEEGSHTNMDEDLTDKENNQDEEYTMNEEDAETEDEDYQPPKASSGKNKSRGNHSKKLPRKKMKSVSELSIEINRHDENQESPNEELSIADGKVQKSKGEAPKKTLKKRGRKPGQTSDMMGKYKCPHCDKSFQNLNYFKLHISGYHKDNPAYQCSTCQKTFFVRNTFVRHLNCHKNEEMGISFPCEVCGKSFFDKYSLLTHNKIHWTEKPFKCDFCDRSFFHQSLLTRHRNLHTKETEYKCSFCNKVFYRKGGLKYHILSIHEKKRDHVCTICGGGFPTKSVLLTHMQSHSSHRAFQCDICGTRVKTKGNLKEHMLCVHTDKRAFKCDICQKTFNRSHRLTLHMMMHRDERPHKCHLCDKAFRTRPNLTVHIKWHQDQRDFQCEQCGKTFLIPGNLDRHMQTHIQGKKTKRRTSKKAPTQTVKPEAAANQGQSQLPVHVEAAVCPTVETQFQTVHNLVAGGGFESDLPTLASIAQHLSTMNIPVFQVPNTSTHGTTNLPVTVNPAGNTCTTIQASVISSDSMALAAFTQAQQQIQGQTNNPPAMPVVSQPVQVQGTFEPIELSM